MRPTKSRGDLVERHQAFIYAQVNRFCRRYQWLDRNETLNEAFRLAHKAATKFDSRRGASFQTFLGYHLKGLHRFAEHRRQESEYALSESELAKRRCEQRIRRNLKFPEGDGTRLTIDRHQGSGARRRRALVRARLPHKEPAKALNTAERISVGLQTVSLADPDLIKAAIEVAAGSSISANVHCFEDAEPQQRMPFERTGWTGWLAELMHDGKQSLTPRARERRRRELIQAANVLRPSLNPNWVIVLDWVLAQIDGSDGRSQVQLGKDNGITKGYVTQIRDRIVELLQLWCERQTRQVNSDHF